MSNHKNILQNRQNDTNTLLKYLNMIYFYLNIKSNKNQSHVSLYEALWNLALSLVTLKITNDDASLSPLGIYCNQPQKILNAFYYDSDKGFMQNNLQQLPKYTTPIYID